MTGATSRQWWSQLPPYLKLNVSVAAAFLIAYLMSQLGFNWLLMPVGVVAFFLPGINLTSALERLSGQRQKPLLTVVWASLISLIITPAGAWAASLALGGDPLSFALAAGLAWWAGTLIITYVFHRYSKALAPLPASLRSSIDFMGRPPESCAAWHGRAATGSIRGGTARPRSAARGGERP